ncbi:MAG TPA: hypothetical protein VFH69_05755, partial [Gemmatimonadota bacterium]|nr:hypothetical protein [Gemmatimonadota bacterium]
MFQHSLNRQFWSRGERGPWSRSFVTALFLHLAIVAVLIRVAASSSAGIEEETTTWLLVGPPGPGGGV